MYYLISCIDNVLTTRRHPKKNQPKPATAAKAAPANAGKGRGRGGREARGGRGGRAGGRENNKKKTVEELDAEMADYFPVAEGNTEALPTGGEAFQATASGDTAMDDEML
jgi:THO complex subunit 4